MYLTAKSWDCLLTILSIHISIPPVAFPMKHGSTMRNIAEACPSWARKLSELEELPYQFDDVQPEKATRKRYKLHHKRGKLTSHKPTLKKHVKCTKSMVFFLSLSH